jgi:hypothetical protein
MWWKKPVRGGAGGWGAWATVMAEVGTGMGALLEPGSGAAGGLGLLAS